jgi:hypothetical protein
MSERFSHLEQIVTGRDLASTGEASTEDAPTIRRDLDDIVGTWVPDAEFDAAVDDQHKIDEQLWIENHHD